MTTMRKNPHHLSQKKKKKVGERGRGFVVLRDSFFFRESNWGRELLEARGRSFPLSDTVQRVFEGETTPCDR